MQIRAGLLARVSTDKQIENTSVDDQWARGRAYCQSKGYEIVTERKESMSGTFILARSEFHDLVELGRTGKLDVIVVDIPDRLGRGEAIGTLEYIAKQGGLRVEYARPGRDTSTVEGMALKATDQLVSGIERINFRRRSMDGKNARANSGQIIRTRFRPFGYKYKVDYDQSTGKRTNCEFIIIDEEAQIVLQMYEWVAGEGLTLYGVTKRLNDMKIPPPSHWEGAGELCVKKKNLRGCWVRATVGKILRSRTYMGEWRWGKNEYHNQDSMEGPKQIKGRRRDISETPIVKVPIIVPKGLWNKVQKQLEENRQKFVRPTSVPFMLRSRLRCAICNGKMCSYTDRRKQTGSYYRCWRNAGSETPGMKRVCRAKLVPVELLDGPVWEYMTEIIKDDRKLFAGLSQSRERAARAHRVIQQSMGAIDAKNERAALDLEQLVDMHLAGDLTREGYRKKKAQIEEAIAKRQLEKADLEERLRAHTYISEDDEIALRALQDALRRRLNPSISTEEKMRILEILKVQCIWDEDAGEVTVSGIFQAKVVSTIDWSGCQHLQGIPFAETLFVRLLTGRTVILRETKQ